MFERGIHAKVFYLFRRGYSSVQKNLFPTRGVPFFFRFNSKVLFNNRSERAKILGILKYSTWQASVSLFHTKLLCIQNYKQVSKRILSKIIPSASWKNIKEESFLLTINNEETKSAYDGPFIQSY